MIKTAENTAMPGVNVRNENDYEDLLSLWSDLESGLGVILRSPDSIQEFELRVWQYDRWMKTMLALDTDVGLYLLFQLATNSPVGYSASHSLVSAVLCHLIAVELGLETSERDSLVHAALTMNIAMTEMQDQLASQSERPSARQTDMIKGHSVKGSLMLANLRVDDPLWLDIVARHHDDKTDAGPLRQVSPVIRLSRILRIVDRYAAMISPRQSRSGRSTAESIRAIITNTTEQDDEVGHCLIRVVGLYPPGSYVRMDNQEVAIVMRRSAQANQPHVAIVVNIHGEQLPRPLTHRSSENDSRIAAALAASMVRLHLNHHVVLQLGANAARQV